MASADQPPTVHATDVEAAGAVHSRRPASGWTMFGTGVAVGLVAALSMIAAISMIYPSTAP